LSDRNFLSVQAFMSIDRERSNEG